MDLADLVSKFRLQFAHLIERGEAVETLFCIVEVGKREERTYYNLYTRAVGTESVENEGPEHLEDVFPSIIKRGGSRVPLSANANLLLLRWVTGKDAFFEWLGEFDGEQQTLPVPEQPGRVFYCYFSVGVFFYNFDPSTLLFPKNVPCAAELSISGDRGLLERAVGVDILGEAVVQLAEVLAIDVTADDARMVGGMEITIPDVRFDVKWRGAPTKTEPGFVVKMIERDPGVLQGGEVRIRDEENGRVFAETVVPIEGDRFFIPGFIPEHQCKVEIVKKGTTLYSDKGRLIKELKLGGGIVGARRKTTFVGRKGEGTVTAEVDIVSPVRREGPEPDREFDTLLLAKRIEEAKRKRVLFVVQPDSQKGIKHEAWELLREIVGSARSYVKVWDPYLTARDLYLLCSTIRMADVEVRALTDFTSARGSVRRRRIRARRFGIRRLSHHIHFPKRAGRDYERTLHLTAKRGVLRGCRYYRRTRRSDSYRAAGRLNGTDRSAEVVFEADTPEGRRRNFLLLCRGAKAKDVRLALRIRGRTGGVERFHDRFIIVDGKTWAIGNSLNCIEEQFSAVIHVPTQDVIEYYFDNLWRRVPEEINNLEA